MKSIVFWNWSSSVLVLVVSTLFCNLLVRPLKKPGLSSKVVLVVWSVLRRLCLEASRIVLIMVDLWPQSRDRQFTFFRGQQVHVNPHPSSHVSRLVFTWHVNRRETWTRHEPEPIFGVNFHVSCRFTFHVGSRRFTFWNLDLHFWGILAWTFMFFF